MARPEVSIVTVCLNSESFIAEAVQSVEAQSVPGLEHIVIDGGSDDATLEILKNYPHLKVVSEADDGVYDAMNKGIKMAQGDIIGIVNSDDRLAPNALYSALAGFDRSGADIITGGVHYIDVNGDVMGSYPVGPREMSPASILLGIPMINARFFKRNALETLGPLRTDLGAAGDREFLLRILASTLRRGWVEKVVYEYRYHEGSGTINPLPQTRKSIWSLHIEFAERLLAESGRSKADRDALLALKQVERLKQLLCGAKDSQEDNGRAKRGDRPVSRSLDWTALLRNLWIWFHERNRHCGY